jgi:hypothetical protein
MALINANLNDIPDPYESIFGNTDVQSYFQPPKQGNTTTFTPHQDNQNDANAPGMMTPIVPIAAQVQKTPQEQLAEMMGEYPTPTYPQASQDRIDRIMKVKALGEGLGALGDIFSLSQGAIVNRRQPDQSIGRYRQMYEQREDDYLRRMDDNNRQRFNNQLQALMFGVQRSDRETDVKFREGQADQSQKNFDKQFDWTVEKTKEAAKQEAEKQAWNMAYQGMTAAERERHNRQMEAASWLRANKTGSEGSQAAKYTLYDSKGKAINLDPHEREAVLTKILDDKNIQMSQDELDLLRPRMGEPISVNAINMLVQKYWERSPDARSYIGQKYGIEQPEKPKAGVPWNTGYGVTKPAGQPITPAPAQMTSPQAQPSKGAQTQPPTKGLSPQQALNKQVQEDVVLSPEQIVSYWQQQGYDIVNDKPYIIAQKMAEKGGVPEHQRPAWIAQTAIKIQRDRDMIDTAKNMQGLNYTPNVTSPQKPEIDYNKIKY